MSEPMAIIRLAPGEVGYYDELSKVHLTLTNPLCYLYDYMNTSAIRRSIRSGRIKLVAGSLIPASKSPQSEANFNKPIIIKKKENETEKLQTKVEEVITSKTEKPVDKKEKVDEVKQEKNNEIKKEKIEVEIKEDKVVEDKGKKNTKKKQEE